MVQLYSILLGSQKEIIYKRSGFLKYKTIGNCVHMVQIKHYKKVYSGK